MPESKATSSYEAFISYRQIEPDKIIAARLHRALETYRVPRSLVREGIPRRLKRIFRDKDELAASSNLGENIQEALKQSRFLIIVCSRRTPESEWVAKEIETFCELGREDRILCLLVEGEPTESFPIPLRQVRSTIVREKGAKHEMEEMTEPLAADIRAPKLSHSLKLLKVEKLRLIAPILGRGFDDLRQREHKRFVRRLILISMLVFAFVMSFTVWGTYTFMQQKEAERRRLVSIAQELANIAPREQEQGRQDERAALLALEAYRINERNEGNRLDQIDKALRQVLSTPYFSVILSASGVDLKSVAFSTDGQWIAAGGDDLKVRLWNLKKRGASPTILPHQSGIVWSLAFSPNEDILAAGTENGHILLWELEKTGQTLAARVLGNHDSNRVTSIAISSDGERLVSGCEDGRVRVWRLHEPEEDPIILHDNEQQGIVWTVTFHPLSSHIVAIGSGEVVRIWDLRQPGAPHRILKGHDNTVISLAFSPDGSTVASGTDRTLLMPSFSEMIEKGLEASERQILVGGTVWLWDLRQEKSEPKILKGHLAKVSSLAFSENGEILASAGSGDNTVRLWQINQLDDSPYVLRGHEGTVEEVAFSPDGQMLASVGGNDSSVRLWDMGRPSGAPIVLHGHTGAIQSLAFSCDGTLASAGGEDCTVRLWNLEEAIEVAKLDHNDGYAVAVAYSPKGKILASGSKTGGIGMAPNNTVRLWDPADPCEPWAVLPGYENSVNSLAFSSSGKELVSAGYLGGEIWLWELDRIQSKAGRTVLKTGSWKISSLKFARENKILVGAVEDTICIWDRTQPGKDPIIFTGDKSLINSIAIGPDGDGWKLAAGSKNGKVALWKNLTKPEKPVWLSHWSEVHCIAIDPNGTTIASGGADGQVRIWDLNNLTSNARVLSGPESTAYQVYALAFSPDGRWLVAGRKNATIIIWPRTKFLARMVCEKVWRNLTEDEWQEYVSTDSYERTCENLPSGKMPKSN